jgi:hypothetical protein
VRRDYIDTLQWAKSVGGLKALIARADANAKIVNDWVAHTPWIENLAADPATRSNTSVCLKVTDPAVAKLSVDAQWTFVKDLVALLEKDGRRLRHRQSSRCAAGPSHLVRRDGRGGRCREAPAVARLGLREGKRSASEGGVNRVPGRAAGANPEFTVRAIPISAFWIPARATRPAGMTRTGSPK